MAYQLLLCDEVETTPQLLNVKKKNCYYLNNVIYFNAVKNDSRFLMYRKYILYGNCT